MARLRFWHGLVLAAVLSATSVAAPDINEELSAADQLRKATKYEEAASAYEKVIDRFPGDPALFKAYARLPELYFRLKKPAEGVAAAKEAFALNDGTFPTQNTLARIAFYEGKCYESLGRFDDCQKTLLKCALWYPWCHWDSVRAVEHLKSINAYSERYAESEVVAKLYFYVCKPDEPTVKGAVDFVVKTLEAVDGNRERVRQFLLFQKFGSAGPDGKTGTEDDVADVLGAIPVPESPEREAALSVARQYYQWDYPGYDQSQKKGYLHLLSGRPKEALRAFAEEYKLCPPESQPLKGATDDVLRALKAVTGNLRAGERFLEFQKYGAPGRDGAQGTADDLADPFEAILGSS